MGTRSASSDWRVNVARTSETSSIMYPPPKRRCSPVPYTSSYEFLRMTVSRPFRTPMAPELMLPLMLLSHPRPNSKLQG